MESQAAVFNTMEDMAKLVFSNIRKVSQVRVSQEEPITAAQEIMYFENIKLCHPISIRSIMLRELKMYGNRKSSLSSTFVYEYSS